MAEAPTTVTSRTPMANAAIVALPSSACGTPSAEKIADLLAFGLGLARAARWSASLIRSNVGLSVVCPSALMR